MRNRLLIVILLLLVFSLFSTQEYKVNFPKLESKTLADSRLPMIYNPGSPKLPYKTVKLLIPQGMKLDNISVIESNTTIKNGIEIDFVREQKTISDKSPDYTKKNSRLYSSYTVYPTESYRILSRQTMNGYSIQTIALFPYRYNPVAKKLYQTESMTIVPSFVGNTKYTGSKMLSMAKDVRNKIASMVLNPDTINSYIKEPDTYNRNIPDTNNPYDMIIITGAEQSSWFADYVTWKESKGISATVVTTQDIYANYAGIDHAEMIRNYIIDAYQAYSTTTNPLKYVILGGDDEIIPIRGVYGEVGDNIDYNMPSDLYFACLDGNWDSNMNLVFGEPSDEVDYYPEISVGRIPAETQIEFDNFFHKVYHYVDNTSYSTNKAAMIGENLNMNPMTWGGDYKDEILVKMPDTFHIETHYERDGTFSRSEVMDCINSGVNIINHMGHANQSFLMGMVTSSVSSLTNTDYGFLFSQGCYPAAFDEGTSQTSESIAENFIIRPGGLMAFIGNTRYGWYYPGSTDGASQFYDRSFFDALYEENIKELGAAHEYCLLDNVDQIDMNPVMRWCHMELILFGDPSIELRDPVDNMPNLELVDVEYSDVNGDNDGNMNPGESIMIHPVIHNIEGWDSAEQVTIELINAEEPIEITQSTIALGQIPANETINPSDSFEVSLPYEIELKDYNITINIKAFISGEEVFNRSFDSQFSVNLLNSNFPWTTNISSKSSPVVIDYNNDGANEILYADNFGCIRILDATGNQIDSLNTNRIENIMSSFAVADIDNDEYLDYVFCSRTGAIYALNHLGEYLFDYTEGGIFIKNPVIADVNNDGFLEAIAMDLQYKFYVLDNEGTPLTGFPKTVDYGAACSPAIADLDNDGFKDIIVGGSTGLLYAYNYLGNVLEGFPVDLGEPIYNNPTIIDNNSIVVATSTQLFTVSGNGGIEASINISSPIANSVIAADFFPAVEGAEIAFVTSNGSIYLLDRNLNTMDGFPVNTGLLYAWPPLAGDVDGDGNVDLLAISQSNNIYLLRRDGTSFAGFPYDLRFNGHVASQLIDIDSDNDLDIVCGVSLGIMVVDTKRPVSGHLNWVTYRGDLQRTGNYNYLPYVENEENEQITYKSCLIGNYPNPFNPTTAIGFALKQSETVSLVIYNIKGQKIKTLTNEKYGSGEHTIVWDGKDSDNNYVSSGIYLYKLNAGTYTKSKKMILMK